MRGTYVVETRLLECFDHLCNLQSAGYSPRPEVDVRSHIL
jgi:hypothetical protein